MNFLSYVKISYRNLSKERTFTLINIFGLSICMAIGLLVIIFIYDQKQTDAFIPHKNEIYRVLTNHHRQDGTSRLHAWAPLEISGLLESQGLPIKELQTLKKIEGEVEVRDASLRFKGLEVSPGFIEFFHLPTQTGHNLREVNQIVIHEKFAKKLFGTASNILGKSLTLKNFGVCTITGVVDSFPRSHIDFDLLLSNISLKNQETIVDWTEASNPYLHYLRIEQKSQLSLVETYLSSLNQRFSKKGLKNKTLTLQPIAAISLGAVVNDDLTVNAPYFVAVFLAILAGIIVVSASFNFIGMSLARAMKKVKEVGIRKIVGAGKKHIILQNLIETQLIMLLALLFATAFLNFIVPAFNEMKILRDIEGAISISFMSHWKLFAIFVIFTLIVGFAAGIYPAVYVSTYRAIDVVNHQPQTSKGSMLFIRKLLIGLQFSFSFLFILTTIVLFHQAKSYTDADYGYRTEELAFLSTNGLNTDVLKERLYLLPGIEAVSGVDQVPTVQSIAPVETRTNRYADPVIASHLHVDDQFLSTVNIPLLMGDDLTAFSQSNLSDKVLINEYLAHEISAQDIENLIGSTLYLKGQDSTILSGKTIIGISNNFKHNFTMAQSKGLVMSYRDSSQNFLLIKATGMDKVFLEQEIDKVMADMSINWSEQNLVWMEDGLSDVYDEFYNLVFIFGLAALLAIIIANLGQFGALTHMINLRMRELAIRKVLGSPSLVLFFLLLKPYFLIITCSAIVGIATGVWINNQWLNLINATISVEIWMVLGTILVVTLTAFLTFAGRMKRVHELNPLLFLKSE